MALLTDGLTVTLTLGAYDSVQVDCPSSSACVVESPVGTRIAYVGGGMESFGPYSSGTQVKLTASGGTVRYDQIDGAANSTVLSASEVAAVQSLVSGDGIAGPAYTWVNRPSAAANAGRIIRITDIGSTAAGSLWLSDGTNWVTLSGRQALASGRSGAPGAGMVTVSATGKLALPAGPMIASGSLALPIGLLRIGTGVRVEASLRHTGTAATWSATWRLGTANASGDSPIVSNLGSATNDQAHWAFMDAHMAGSTSMVTGFNLAPNGSASAGSLQTRTTNIDLSAAMFIGLHVSALTAGDTLELISYCISFHD